MMMLAPYGALMLFCGFIPLLVAIREVANPSWINLKGSYSTIFKILGDFRVIPDLKNALFLLVVFVPITMIVVMAVSLLLDPKVKSAFDVTQADPAIQDRYGRNSFGWSCLMARRLVKAGVGLVQVNLGNNEVWDTHGNAFPNLKDKLLPPTDRAVAALLDDRAERGLLDSTNGDGP